MTFLARDGQSARTEQVNAVLAGGGAHTLRFGRDMLRILETRASRKKNSTDPRVGVESGNPESSVR